MKTSLRIISLVVLSVFAFSQTLAYAATSDTVVVNATVAEGTSSVEIVEAGPINFGTITGTQGTHRFTAGPMTVAYFAANDAWTVRVYTDNSPGGGAEPEKAGLVGGAVGSEVYVPLKIWNGNYGPTASLPDVGNSYFWAGYDFNDDGDKNDVLTSGTYSEVTLGFDINGDGDATDTITATAVDPLSEEAVYLRIVEKDEHTSNPLSWRRLTYAGAELEETGFENTLGVDVQGVAAQAYTTTLNVDIIHE